MVRNNSNSIPERLLKIHGRWKSDSAKDMYVEESLENKLKVSYESVLRSFSMFIFLTRFLEESSDEINQRFVVKMGFCQTPTELCFSYRSKMSLSRVRRFRFKKTLTLPLQCESKTSLATSKAMFMTKRLS